MNYGLFLSIIAHVLVMIILSFKFFAPKPLAKDQAVVVDLVDISQVNNLNLTKQKAKLAETNQDKAEQFPKEREVKKDEARNVEEVNETPQAAESKEEPKKEDPKPIKPEEKPAEKPKEEPAKEETPKKEPEPKETKPEETKKPTPKPKEEPKKETPKKTPPKKPAKKPAAKKATKSDKEKKSAAKKQDSLDRLTESIMKSLDENTAKEKKEQLSKSEALGKSNTPHDQTKGLSMTEMEYIMRKISNNWNTTYFVGTQDKNMQVDLYVKLNKEGVVEEVKVDKRYSTDSDQYALFIDSAIRAVKKASPFDKLKEENYEIWKEIILTFDPSGLVY